MNLRKRKIKLNLNSKNLEDNSQRNSNRREQSSSYLKSNAKFKNTYTKSQSEPKEKEEIKDIIEISKNASNFSEQIIEEVMPTTQKTVKCFAYNENEETKAIKSQGTTKEIEKVGTNKTERISSKNYTDLGINAEDLPISIEYDEESEHLDVFVKYDSDISTKSIFCAVLSQLNQDVKYITLNLVDEVSTSMFADSEEKDINEISNIKELTITSIF